MFTICVKGVFLGYVVLITSSDRQSPVTKTVKPRIEKVINSFVSSIFLSLDNVFLFFEFQYL